MELLSFGRLKVSLRILVETTELSADQVAVQTRLIYDNLLKESQYVDGGNFTAIHTSDLERLFNEYELPGHSTKPSKSVASVLENDLVRDSSITLRVYAHWLPDAGAERGVDRLDDDATICNPAATRGRKAEGDDRANVLKKSGEPPRNRTGNPQIKSLLLCQLS